MIHSTEEFLDFLANDPLYRKFELFCEPNVNVKDFLNLGVSFNCPCSQIPQTFILQMPEGDSIGLEMKTPSYIDTTFKERNGFFLVQDFVGYCQKCKKANYFVTLLIQQKDVEENPFSIFIEKIGQFPPFSIKPDPIIKKFLKEPQLNLYRNGLMNMSTGFGIGAFTYFRRVVEDTVRQLLEELAEIPGENQTKIKALIDENQKKQLSNIIDSIYPFLPDSLKSLGQNPIKILWDQTSSGIHELSEDECLDNAKIIDEILKFVVKKISEEKNENVKIRNHIKNLKVK